MENIWFLIELVRSNRYLNVTKSKVGSILDIINNTWASLGSSSAISFGLWFLLQHLKRNMHKITLLCFCYLNSFFCNIRLERMCFIGHVKVGYTSECVIKSERKLIYPRKYMLNCTCTMYKSRRSEIMIENC